MDDHFDITNPGIEQIFHQKAPSSQSKKISISSGITVSKNNNNANTLKQQSTTAAATAAAEKKKLNSSEDEADRFAQERKDRYWEHMMSKIAFVPDREDFYKEYNYVVKPGFGIFKAIANARFGFRSLCVNIPETIMVQDTNTFLVYTDEFGRVRRKPDSSWTEFELRCKREHDGFCNRFKSQIESFSKNRKFNDRMSIFELYEKIDTKINPECPIMILRGSGSNDWKLTQNVYQSKSLSEKRQTEASNISVEQRFIFSRPMKATVLRLVYNTRNSSGTGANYAYRIQNYTEIFDPDTKKNVNLKTCLNSDKKNSFDAQHVKGTGLKEYERQAESLVLFLEKNNQVRISQVVLDFIQDLEGKIWLISMKSIRAENTISMEEIMAKKANPEEDSSKTLDQLTCSVYCKLCGILFKKDDASKMLTYKLLWELVQHLKKRNIPLKNIKVSHSSTRPCRVCNLCYMLVVGEHELIEIEQKFAEAQNIPIYDAVIRVPIDTKPKHRPALLNESLNQWRLIFYICDISNIGIEQNIDFSNLYFQYKLHNYKTSFKVTPPADPADRANRATPSAGDQANLHNRSSFKSSRSDAGVKSPTSPSNQQGTMNSNGGAASGGATATKHFSHLNMNHIRVHYFFSEELNIEKFLKDTQIKVRLTQGPDWNQFLAEGSSKTISHFKNKEMGGQRHSSQILLFFENAKYCVLKINAGLVCDGEYNTGKLNLHKYNDIYFPDESFYNSNPFPDEWMEMFDPQYVSRKEDMKEQEGTEKYSPKCTPAELNKMIDFNSHKNKLNVQSKVSQMIRAQSAVTLKNMSMNNQQQQQQQQNQQMHTFTGGMTTSKPYPYDQTEHSQQPGFVPFGQKSNLGAGAQFQQHHYNESNQNNMNSVDPTLPKPSNNRAATARNPLLRRVSASEKKLQRPKTSVQQQQQQQQAQQQQDAQNQGSGKQLESDPSKMVGPRGSYGYILNNDDKKKRHLEMQAQLKKYGLDDDSDGLGADDDDAVDSNGSIDEAEDIIREKLREHFKQINKMNDQQQQDS